MKQSTLAGKLRQHALTNCRPDIRLRHIALIVRNHARVHHAKPQWRHIREHDHGRVTGRQLRCALEMTQRLVRTRRIRMMIGVTLQLVQKQIRHDAIAIP